MWDSDKIIMSYVSKYSSGYKYVIIFVNFLTRFTFTRPLKTLQGREIKDAMEDVFSHSSPDILRSDGGTEYNNVIVKSYLKNKNIKHVVTKNETKAALAERGIKVLRTKLAKYNTTYEWVSVLPELTEGINKTFNRGIQMSPHEALHTDRVTLWNIQHKLKVDKEAVSVKKGKHAPYAKNPYHVKVKLW